MVTYEDTKYQFARLSPGEDHALGRTRLPVFAINGDIDWEEADGARPFRVPVRRFLRRVGVLENGASIVELARAVGNPSVLFASSRFELIVTDARIVIVHDTLDGNGARVAGHIRYPWMQSIGFRPKQSFLNDSEIVVDAIEDFDVDEFPHRHSGSFLHQFTFLLDKTFHPGELAREISRRSASYIATTQGIPDSGRLDNMRAAELLSDPAKGEHSRYNLPVYCAYPEGAYGLDGDSVRTTWISQRE